MPRVAPVVPDETDLLCEGCGYTLNGLPPAGNCPECGKLIEQSVGRHRVAPEWESSGRFRAFLRTTASVLLQPTRFYRTITTREHSSRAEWFGTIYLTATALLLTTAGLAHAIWFNDWWRQMRSTPGLVLLGVALAVIVLGVLMGTNWLAVKLTCWEAAYRGFRLPATVVRRGMHYHAAHYLPVAALAFLTVFGYRMMLVRGWLEPLTLEYYLYILSGEVVAAAVYLFKTYWIAMRNMMYANR